MTSGRFSPPPGRPLARDVVVGGATDPQVQLLQNDGFGQLTALPALTLQAATGSIADIAAADLNADDNLDVVVTNPASGRVLAVLGDGRENLREGAHADVGAVPGRVVIADVTGDGIIDSVVATDSGIVVLPGNPDGSFGAPLRFAGGSPVADLAVLDVNGDGLNDVVAARPAQHVVEVYVRDGATFALHQQLSVPDPVALAVGDYTGDGVRDLVVADGLDQQLAVFDGTADGFASSPRVTSGVAAARIASADIDGDGRLDVVALDRPDAIVRIALGNGDGTFRIVASPSVHPGSAALGLAVADVDGDGKPDVVLTLPQPQEVVIGINLSPAVVCGGDCNHDEIVSPDELQRLVYIGLGHANDCEAGDLNHDGMISINELLTAMRNAVDGCK